MINDNVVGNGLIHPRAARFRFNCANALFIVMRALEDE